MQKGEFFRLEGNQAINLDHISKFDWNEERSSANVYMSDGAHIGLVGEDVTKFLDMALPKSRGKKGDKDKEPKQLRSTGNQKIQ